MKYCRLTMQHIVLLILILYTDDVLGQFFNATVSLPENAKDEIKACYNIGVSQNVQADDLWQVQLACLSEYYKNLPINNRTDDDMKLFIEAEENRFGFTAPPTGFRTRRDLRTLTDEEWNRTVNVFLEMYKSGTLRAFGRLHSEVNKKAHKGAAFLVWHRVFLTHFEEEMRKIDPSVSLPYWDSSADFYIAKPTESVVWSDCFMGSGNGAISGYFENFYGTHYSYITRNASRDCKGKLISLDDVNKLLQFCHFKDITTGKQTEDEYQNQKHNLELLHDMVHDWVGGDMGKISNSAFDPIFFMHHAYVDYIFEEFRQHQATSCDDVNLERDYRPPDDLCQTCSDTDTQGHGRYDTMWGYNHIRNIDGLWLNWTTEFYNYEPRPSCPDTCSGKYLYCDKSFNISMYPDGICVTRTKDEFTCNKLRVKRDANFLTPSISCDTSGIKFELLHGDGTNNSMSVKTASEKLKMFFTSFIGIETSIKEDESESTPSATGIIFGIVLGMVIIVLIAYICRKYAQSSEGRAYTTTSTQCAL